MRHFIQTLLIISSLFLFSCAKDDVPHQIGTWEGMQYQTIKTDGIQSGESSLNIELTLMESGRGMLTGPIPGSDGTIHWVVDNTENTIYIISNLTLSNGNEVSTTDKFDMIINTADEQKWEQTDLYQNPSGEEIEVFTRWSFLK